MTSAEIRQSFLDFFHQQQHTIVPSSSLLPDSPGLLFTNAGMNQFVPIFLGDKKPDVAKWAGVRPAADNRAADTQKCIRAGGKHNDLEDVGWDTYHHTMFEMLGNWSFGDYFKKESLTWGWTLLTQVWGIPAKRLFATVYSPNKAKNDPSEFDQEAYDIWAGLFRAAGLDPAVHIVNGNRKDNFWQMGDTGPCGPCSEIHFNLNESDDEAAGRVLVNSSSSRCIEIWNHVFIQFNGNADGTFSPLAAKHVDTGMGFERVAGIYATTKGFKDFSAEPSNYNSDVFTELFDVVEKLSGKTYGRTVPTKREGLTEQEKTDIAFRVLADHARCVSCAIADGILPGNDGRNYVIRRILRRGILYGRKDLGLSVGFFEKLVAAVVASLGNVFPELKSQQSIIERVVRSEEESFGRTLDEGLTLFGAIAGFPGRVAGAAESLACVGEFEESNDPRHFNDAFATAFLALNGVVETQGKLRPEQIANLLGVSRVAEQALLNLRSLRNTAAHAHSTAAVHAIVPQIYAARDSLSAVLTELDSRSGIFPGLASFQLYDTYGFPLDMTQLLAVERGLTVDVAGFEAEMEKQRALGRAAQKKEIIVAATEGSETVAHQPTKFVGYTELETEAKLLEVVRSDNDTFLVFDQTPFYAEMGGQTGDTGTVTIGSQSLQISDTVKDKSGRYLHKLSGAFNFDSSTSTGSTAILAVDAPRRRAISRHHSAEHLIHWALRKTLGTHVRQAGTSKTPDRMRFDFAHFEAVAPAQLREIEQLVNERILDNALVDTYETDFDKKPEGTLAFFSEKYGKTVRVVDIGGYSRELCGGTHVSTTGEIGLIKIVSEMAIAAGTRRLEVVAGQAALSFVEDHESQLRAAAARLRSGPLEVEKRIEALMAEKAEMEKKLKAFEQKAAAGLADELAAKAVEKDGLKFVSAVVTAETPDALRALGAQILAKLGEGVVQLGAAIGDKASVVALCSPAAIKSGKQAGKIVGELCAKLGGKGGGKPDFAMGGGKDTAKLAEVLAS